MLKNLAGVAFLVASLWPLVADAGSGNVGISLTDISLRDNSNGEFLNPSYHGCGLTVAVSNETEDHLNELSGDISGVFGWSFKDVPAHGSSSQTNCCYSSRSCSYALGQFQEAATHRLAINFSRCALEGEREGNCESMVSIHVDPTVTQNKASQLDQQDREDILAAQKLFCQANDTTEVRSVVGCLKSCGWNRVDTDACIDKCVPVDQIYHSFYPDDVGGKVRLSAPHSGLSDLVDFCFGDTSLHKD